jgi:ferrous iron transport protein A
MITLIDLPDGSTAIVKKINGGYGLVQKLDALGICIGKEITKVSRHWMKGPVIIRSVNTEVAIGYGMASRIMVEKK